MEQQRKDQPQSRDRVWGLMIIGAAFLAALCLSWWARGVASPTELERPAPPTPDGVAGFPKQVDVIATLEVARTLTKRLDLRGMTATGVRSDGTVDVTGSGHFINYTFSSSRGEGPQPIRPPGTLPKHAYCGKQIVRVSKEGIGAEPDQVGLTCTALADPLPMPRCGPKQVWQSAIKHGSPTDQLALVEYFRSVTGPAWRFTVNGQKPLVFYGDCERELTGSETSVAP